MGRRPPPKHGIGRRADGSRRKPRVEQGEHTWRRTRRWALDRADHRCEVRVADDCAIAADRVHHVHPREDGGADSEANLLAICEACHRWVHKNEDESIEAGWLRRSAPDATGEDHKEDKHE